MRQILVGTSFAIALLFVIAPGIAPAKPASMADRRCATAWNRYARPAQRNLLIGADPVGAMAIIDLRRPTTCTLIFFPSDGSALATSSVLTWAGVARWRALSGFPPLMAEAMGGELYHVDASGRMVKPRR